VRLPVVIVLLIQSFAVAFASDQPNPADFSIKVHVVSSRSRAVPNSINNGIAAQFLETIIDNQPVELGCTSAGVLALGDYPARLSTKVHAPSKHPNTYDIYQGYDLLMPDKEIRTCSVTGLGPIPATNP
jgi:hypothetical protein